jgi:hypothetical protein
VDPNLFHLDWERTLEVLGAITVLAFLVERALAVLVESRIWIGSAMDKSAGKEVLAVLLGAGLCIMLKFDAPSMIILTAKTGHLGEVLTGAVIAGGSKASVKLFQDVLNIRNSAVTEKKAAAAGLSTGVAAAAASAVTGAPAAAVTPGPTTVVATTKDKP